MPNPDPDHQIQATSSATSAPPPDALDRPQGNDITGRQRTRLGGTVFGALAGIPLGALVSAVCCWLTDFGDYAWEGALVGALLGFGGGAGIGFLERTIRGDLLNPEIATIIGGIFGLLVTLLLLTGLGEDVAGKFRALLFLGILCAGPAGGLLVGAFLDRAHEASRQGSWGSAIGFAGFAIVACAGVVFLIARYSHPDPEEVASEARELVLNRWRAQLEGRNAKIRKITLTHQDHRTYVGTMAASIDGQALIYDLEVRMRRGTINASWILRE